MNVKHKNYLIYSDIQRIIIINVRLKKISDKNFKLSENYKLYVSFIRSLSGHNAMYGDIQRYMANAQRIQRCFRYY